MKEIPLYKFLKEKYHKELLMDLVDVSFIRPWLRKTPVHRDNFYRIIFVTDGHGNVTLNGRHSNLSVGDIVCSIPGDIWDWHLENDSLEGYVLLFEEAFLTSFFTDTRFLEKLSYLQPCRLSPFLHAAPTLFDKIAELFRLTKDEINLREKSNPHFLRAMTYGVLTMIDRADIRLTSDKSVDMTVNRHIDKFIRLVNEHFATEHEIEFYADKLCVTSNYLNKIVKRVLGVNTKSYIQERIMAEARKLLSYTSLSVSEISVLLNFNTATYFSRFFMRNASVTPQQFRDSPEK